METTFKQNHSLNVDITDFDYVKQSMYVDKKWKMWRAEIKREKRGH